MAQHIKVGTQLDPHERSGDVYVVERIVHMKAGGYTITARTLAQRACGVAGASMTTWTDMELAQLVQRGKLTILLA